MFFAGLRCFAPLTVGRRNRHDYLIKQANCVSEHVLKGSVVFELTELTIGTNKIYVKPIFACALHTFYFNYVQVYEQKLVDFQSKLFI